VVDQRDDTDLESDEPEEAETLDLTLPTLQPRRKLNEGDVVLDRYRISGVLGRGGMGIVYRCFDQVSEIDVALKGIPPEISHDTNEMEEIRENFKLIARLFHPNIAAAKTLEWDKTTGVYYLVMECAEGANLRRHIKELTKDAEGGASIDDVVAILQPVAAALDFAHSRKIIHRDIKPGNIIVNTNGDIKVLDFGIASQFHASLSRVTRAADYSASGTLPYMSPEQCRGHHQDARTDQYSLAVVAYEMLAGRPPFENPEIGVLREAILTQAPERPSGLETRHWKVLSRALAKDRKQRFRTCSEFMSAFTKRASATGTGSEEAPRKFIVRIGAIVVICLLVAVSVLYWPAPTEKSRKSPTPNVAVPADPVATPSKVNETAGPRTAADWLVHAERFHEQQAWAEAISAYVKVLRDFPESGAFETASRQVSQIIEDMLKQDRETVRVVIENSVNHLAEAGRNGVTSAFLLLGKYYEDKDIDKSIAHYRDAATGFEETPDWPRVVESNLRIVQVAGTRLAGRQALDKLESILLKFVHAEPGFDKALLKKMQPLLPDIGALNISPEVLLLGEQLYSIDQGEAHRWLRNAARAFLRTGRHKDAVLMNLKLTELFKGTKQGVSARKQLDLIISDFRNDEEWPLSESKFDDIEPELVKAAEIDISSALMFLGDHLHENQQYALAFRWYERAAALTNVSAMTQVGLMLSNGHGVQKNSKASAEWFKKACEEDDPLGAYWLSLCYRNGIGVPKDESAAFKIMEESAEDSNHPDSIDLLASCYAEGRGTEKNLEESVRLYELAIDRGHTDSYAELARIYFTGGEGFARNGPKAMRLLLDGVEEGNTMCMYAYAYSLELGLAGNKNPKSAEGYYKQAAGRGHEGAIAWCEENGVAYKVAAPDEEI